MPKGNSDSRKGGDHNFGSGGKKSSGNTLKTYREGNAFGGATGVTPSGKPKAESKRGNNRP